MIIEYRNLLESTATYTLLVTPATITVTAFDVTSSYHVIASGGERRHHRRRRVQSETAPLPKLVYTQQVTAARVEARGSHVQSRIDRRLTVVSQARVTVVAFPVEVSRASHLLIDTAYVSVRTRSVTSRQLLRSTITRSTVRVLTTLVDSTHTQIDRSRRLTQQQLDDEILFLLEVA